jgi:hypothetical protein
MDAEVSRNYLVHGFLIRKEFLAGKVAIETKSRNLSEGHPTHLTNRDFDQWSQKEDL